MLNYLGVSQFISDWFPIFQIILVSVMGLASLVMIIAILVQPAQLPEGQNAITGTSESYYAKNRSANSEGRMKRLTVICSIIIAICAVAYFITYTFYQGSI